MNFDNEFDKITPSLTSSITVGGTGALILPIGTVAQRPAAANGIIRYNSDTNTIDIVISGAYQSTSPYAPSAVVITGGSINGTTIGATTASTGAFTTLSASSTVTLSPASANVVLSPTGTGVVTINPATLGSIDNVTVGATTASTGRFTTVLSTVAIGTAPFTVTSTTPVTNLSIGGNAATATTATAANALNSATTTVVVNAATAPILGQVLTATSGTAATWQTSVSMVYPGAGIPNSTGTAWTTSYTTTGTGTVLALATSPTFVTPILGTPTSGTLTNCTFPTLNQSTTGTAAIATTSTITAVATNAAFYPVFVSATTGNLALDVDTGLAFNPSTNTLTTGIVSASTLVSTVAIGTAPFTVTSTTAVTNLSIGGSATSLSGASYVQSTGLSTSWGVTSGTTTGAVNAIMGTGTSATWLLSGTSGGTFRYGIQGLDAGAILKFWSGATAFTFNSNVLAANQLSSTVAIGTAPFVVTSTTPVTNLSIGGNAATATTATAANALNTATTTVVVNAATAPSAGQALVATSSTAASWQTPVGGPLALLETEAVIATPSYTVGSAVIASGVTVTATSPAVFSLALHGLLAGSQIVFTTTGTMPSGVNINTVYFVITAGLTTGQFEISLSDGGAAIGATTTGSGTLSVGQLVNAMIFTPLDISAGTTLTIPFGNTLIVTPPPGAADVAATVTITLPTANAAYYPTFVSATTGNLALGVDAGLTFNPYTNALVSLGTVQAGQLVSLASTGTAPFITASTTQVANLNAATAGTAANGSGTSFFTSGGAGENDIGVLCSGYNSAYLYNNNTNWGLYSAAGGVMCTYTRSNGLFTFSGTATNVTGTVNIANGGTGATLSQTAQNALANRVNTITSSSTPTPVCDTTDTFTVTALAAAATFGAPTYTTAPVDGQALVIRIKDNGAAQTLAFNAIYRIVGATLPTTTVISKLIYITMFYNVADTKWDVVGVGKQA